MFGRDKTPKESENKLPVQEVLCKFCNSSKIIRLYAGGFTNFELRISNDTPVVLCKDCGKIGVLK